MATTQGDIAEKVGVSVNTVSVVLRGTEAPLISERTRQQILETARELGYRPNHHARALAGAKAPVIKFAFRPTGDYISNRKAFSLMHVLSGLDRDLSIAGDISYEKPDSAVETLAWGSPEAVVCRLVETSSDSVASIAEQLHEKDIHLVITDLYDELDEDVPCDTIRLDRFDGARRAVDHLIELGHRQIGLITCELYRGREDAYHAALEDAGIDARHVSRIDMPQEVTFDPQREFTRRATERTRALLGDAPSITALICPSDMAALGAINALRDLELDVPEDVSVIGFQDDPWTQFVEVPLTTMAEPVEETCQLCRRILKARLEGDEGPWRRETTEYRLIDRASTAPPSR